MFPNSNPISQPQKDDRQKTRNFYFSNFARPDQERNNSISNRSSTSTNQNPNDLNIFRSGHRSMQHNDRQQPTQGLTNGNLNITNSRFQSNTNTTQNNDDPFNFFKNAPKNVPSSMQMRRAQRTPPTITPTQSVYGGTQTRNTIPINSNPASTMIGKQYGQANPFNKNCNNDRVNTQNNAMNTINFNIGNTQQNNMNTNGMGNGRLNFGNNSYSNSFNTNSNNNVNTFTGNNKSPFYNSTNSNTNTNTSINTNINTNPNANTNANTHNPFFKNSSSNSVNNTNAPNSPFTPNPSLNRFLNASQVNSNQVNSNQINNNQINNNSSFGNNSFIHNNHIQQNELQQPQQMQMQMHQQQQQQVHENQLPYPYSEQQQQQFLLQQQQLGGQQQQQFNGTSEQYYQTQISCEYQNQIQQQLPINNHQPYNQQYRTSQQSYLNVFTHMLSQFCQDYKDYITQNLPRKTIQTDHIYNQLFNEEQNDFSFTKLSPYQHQLDQIQEEFNVLHRKKRQKRIVVKVVPSLLNPHYNPYRRSAHRRLFSESSTNNKCVDLYKMSYQQIMQRQLNSQSQYTINNQQKEYLPNRESEPEVSQFTQSRKLEYIVDLRWVEEPDFIRKVFSKSTVQVSDLPTSQQIEEAILKDLKNKNEQFEKKFIFKQHSFKLKKIVPNFFNRWFYGEKQRQVRQFIVQASIYEKKINLPEGYEYSPVQFKGFIVKDLKIYNKFGSIVWVGKTEIKQINFLKGIKIDKLQVYCEIPALEKPAIVQFFSLPQQCKDKQEENIEKLLKKLSKGCQFIEFNKIKRSWMIKVDFSKEQE